MEKFFLGIDVSKATLEIAFKDDGETQTIRNNPEAVAKWLETLPGPSMIGVESTGNYHSLVATMSYEAGHTVYLLQPRNVKNYAQGIGVRIKTDASDAEVIRRYISREYKDLRPFTPATALITDLQILIKRRAAVTGSRMSIKQSFNGIELMSQELKVLIKQLDCFIAQIDRTMLSLIREDAAFNSNRERLTSIPGVGLVTGMALAVLFQRYSFEKPDSVVSYVGLEPKVRQSGAWSGKRKISKRGPGELRRLLFIAALTASRKPAWREIYDRHKAKGLSSTASLVILSRKILKTAFAIWNKAGALYDEKKLMNA